MTKKITNAPAEPLPTQEAMILRAVEKTGFPLEHRTATKFADAGWTVVSNKYYVDDTSGEVREIDLIAYKVNKLEEYNVFSAVIVSCKKTSDNKWVFLTRSVKPADPNVNLTPFHFWTNDPALRFSLSQDGFAKRFTQQLSTPSPLAWGLPEREIFGFQELAPAPLNKQNGNIVSRLTPNNDRALFSSIRSLMKAQAYELERLPNRMKLPAVYVFSLLSVMDGEMFEVQYDHSPANVVKTDFQKYIAHYIVKGKEQFSRINFVHPDKLVKLIGEYDAAHAQASVEIEAARKDFYAGVFANPKRKAVLLPLFASKVVPILNLWSDLKESQRFTKEGLDLDFAASDDLLKIQIFSAAPDEAIEVLNDVERVQERTKELLKDIFKYEGKFVYAVDDIPF